ncbi:histidine phosphatase family protein [Erwinia sorbitola]|uniref:Histidine phosphatase family protein n=1 Tax=Erwinia sorbitola TaxID=2681984 RepID=A0A6I6EVA2_9GAMM|nr:histidine phosphatase family protein [Erwinia sorbitola]MTD27503.1 histidine phosphatase family protein [Erwinia sorbitola]QGU89039.1 histidine phosphatase family protein [Erwinia sorbitola]
MTITLMRHGKPDHYLPGRRSALAMAEWCEAYDLAEICDLPPERSLRLAADADIIVTSTLPRALSSLAKLGQSASHVDAIYREAALPVMPLAFPALPPLLWLPLLRAMWLFGYKGQVESYAQAKQRAIMAAEQLIQLSAKGNVLLVGHGIMNKLIARRLRHLGWLGEKHASSRYWSSAIYHPPVI